MQEEFNPKNTGLITESVNLIELEWGNKEIRFHGILRIEPYRLMIATHLIGPVCYLYAGYDGITIEKHSTGNPPKTRQFININWIINGLNDPSYESLVSYCKRFEEATQKNLPYLKNKYSAYPYFTFDEEAPAIKYTKIP